MTVRQLLESLDSAELSEWIAYYRLRATPAGDGATVERKLEAIFGRRRDER